MNKQPIAAAIAALGLALAATGVSAQTAPATGAAATGGVAGTAGVAPVPARDPNAATPPATTARPAAAPGATATAVPQTPAVVTTTTTSPAAGTAGADRPTTAGAPVGAATGATTGAGVGATTGAPLGTAPGAAAPRAAVGQPVAGPVSDRQARADWDRRHRASKMLGTNVRDQQGDRVGSIEDVVLDPEGRVAYAVISAGGFLGMGENLYAVPWNSLNIQPGQDHYVMNVDKERMKAAHGFEKDNWPDMTDAKWQASTRGAFGPAMTTPAVGQPAPAVTRTAPATGVAPAGQQQVPAATIPAPGQQQPPVGGPAR